MDSILKLVSDYAAGLTFEQLPPVTLHQVKRHLIDTLGCAIGAYGMVPPTIARDQALEVRSTPGATVFGTRHRTAPDMAAFANGVAARYLDFNDTSMSGKSGHTSDNVMGTLAAAEYAGANMKTIITSIVLAYEVHDRFGDGCIELRNIGWDHVVYVVLGTAAGAAKALGLNQEQIANAISLAVVPNGGMGQTRVGQLSMWKGCAAGNAARNGVFAALLARLGLTGPAEPFEGSWGLKHLFGTKLNLPAFGGGPVPFSIDTDKFKYYPSDYEAQCSITPAVELHQKLGGQTGDIASIDIETYSHAVEVAADTRDKWDPQSRETADHSIPYVVAVGLTRGFVWFEDFTMERIRDPKVLALMQKIRIKATPECDRIWPDAYPFRITLTMKSGEKHFAEVKYAKGHPKNPMSDEEIEIKFRKLAEPAIGPERTARALRQLWQLEKMKGARQILRLFEV